MIRSSLNTKRLSLPSGPPNPQDLSPQKLLALKQQMHVDYNLAQGGGVASGLTGQSAGRDYDDEIIPAGMAPPPRRERSGSQPLVHTQPILAGLSQGLGGHPIQGGQITPGNTPPQQRSPPPSSVNSQASPPTTCNPAFPGAASAAGAAAGTLFYRYLFRVA